MMWNRGDKGHGWRKRHSIINDVYINNVINYDVIINDVVIKNLKRNNVIINDVISYDINSNAVMKNHVISCDVKRNDVVNNDLIRNRDESDEEMGRDGGWTMSRGRFYLFIYSQKLKCLKGK